MTISIISAAEAKRKLEENALLIDIRQPDEYQREHIKGSVLHPLQLLQASGLPNAAQQHTTLIFHCKSGMRTQSTHKLISQLTKSNNFDVFILENGLDGWKKSGYDTIIDHSQPIELMRQVQITAGLLVLLGVTLGWFVTPIFYLLSAFIGAGLIFAGITGLCSMAKLLSLMPWNRC
ncbi:rhodanese family protein [Glaesserella sp.]|uniref:rhodanese family protein n=1 Tax=Glaesserella sp. TaxID=2094731 RepID=UPI00359F66A3